jgi:hypothetical protein
LFWSYGELFPWAISISISLAASRFGHENIITRMNVLRIWFDSQIRSIYFEKLKRTFWEFDLIVKLDPSIYFEKLKIQTIETFFHRIIFTVHFDRLGKKTILILSKFEHLNTGLQEFLNINLDYNLHIQPEETCIWTTHPEIVIPTLDKIMKMSRPSHIARWTSWALKSF